MRQWTRQQLIEHYLNQCEARYRAEDMADRVLEKYAELESSATPLQEREDNNVNNG